MRVPLFQIDAFTTQRFAGNPAAVMVLDAFPGDALLQALAAENNLSETAFLVREGNDWRLRWFTPTTEVPLCGHATLASGAVVLERLDPGRDQVVFHTLSGPLTVRRAAGGYRMDFPARPCAPLAAPAGLAEALGRAPQATFGDGFNILALYDAQALHGLAPDMDRLRQVAARGVIATAPGEGPYDFFSRYFAPALGVDEDPVTGSAHCTLAPFWAERLGRTELHARQVSRRGGDVTCRVRGERVELEGACVFYLEGEAEIGVSAA